MLDAGRALYHLQQTIDDPRCSIVLVSYQAPQSLGYRLLQRGPSIFFLGKVWNKWADVIALNGFSGHADQQDFLRTLAPLAGRTAKVKLVHGELDQAEILAQNLRGRGFADVGIPERQQMTLVA
jgi:metallo-beta-lactamase family protein